MRGLSSDLAAVLGALDERARSDPTLDRYRVVGRGAAAVDDVPAGWFVSDAIAQIACDGGWWPGVWWFPVVDDIVALVLTGRTEPPPDAEVVWLGVGSVWERDGFWTPALRERSESAPLFGFSNQALWSSMVFPTEAALLEAFIVTYDELGVDERGEVNPFFVEWITGPPAASEPERAHDVHRRLRTLSSGWTTDHRCWVPAGMPRLQEGFWPPDLVAAVLGLT
jgi:hypothetical protein